MAVWQACLYAAQRSENHAG